MVNQMTIFKLINPKWFCQLHSCHDCIKCNYPDELWMEGPVETIIERSSDDDKRLDGFDIANEWK